MSGNVPVQAVIRNVGLRTGEPSREGRVPVQNLGPFFEPVNFTGGEIAPKFLGVLFSVAVKFEIALHSLDMGLADEIFARGVDGRDAHGIGLYQSASGR